MNKTEQDFATADFNITPIDEHNNDVKEWKSKKHHNTIRNKVCLALKNAFKAINYQFNDLKKQPLFKDKQSNRWIYDKTRKDMVTTQRGFFIDDKPIGRHKMYDFHGQLYEIRTYDVDGTLVHIESLSYYHKNLGYERMLVGANDYHI